MDQYFNQMEKIVKERKTSSRIRFMLQDVIDLRLVSEFVCLFVFLGLTAAHVNIIRNYFMIWVTSCFSTTGCPGELI